jgi:prolyl oligopeptidase PreP (S9A serine peptidase family)
LFWDATAQHGVLVKDPYRYFENIKSPEVQTWLKGQGEYARGTLDRIALRDDLEKRITELTVANGKPVLLRLDMQAGHGMGNTATQRNAMSADIYSFLLWQIGKTRLKR